MVNGNSILLEMKGAGLGYDGCAILHDVDLSIRSGEIVCLLGQNGAGKTTLFRTLLGFIKPVYGSITIDGRDISRFSRSEFARMVSWVPQSHVTPFSYEARDVVLFGRSVHLGMFASPGKEDKAIAMRCLDLLDIAHLAKRSFPELSGGERQMVLIARALAQEARFMILDEPASNLDYGNQVRVIRKIRELSQQSIGILMATHHPDHAFMTASKVAVLDRGRLCDAGEPERMLTPETLKRLYGVDVQVFDTPAGRSAVRKVCAPVVE
jgi:iron complex transport system ATP-binding protein